MPCNPKMKKKEEKPKEVEETPIINTPPKAKRLKDMKTSEVRLEVYECVCGVRVGIDGALSKTRQVIAYCPDCGRRIESDWDEE